MFFWGIVNMSMGFVKTYAQLVVLRFLLGTLEAGVIPGIVYLTSMYYKRHDFQVRMSSFFCSVVVAGAFGGVSNRKILSFSSSWVDELTLSFLLLLPISSSHTPSQI